MPPTAPAQRLPRSIRALGFASLLTGVSSAMIHGLLPVLSVGTLGMRVFRLGLVEGAAVAVASALGVRVFSGALSKPPFGRHGPTFRTAEA